MKAALLSDRGVVKVAGDDARKFLNGLVTSDLAKLAPGNARFAALLTPQAKIIADFFVAEASDGSGFFLDCPRALAATLVERLNFYRLRAKVTIEDRSASLGVLAIWHGDIDAHRGGVHRGDIHRGTENGLCYADPRLPELGLRCVLPPERAGAAASDLGATLVGADQYDGHRITLAVPQGGVDFIYSDAFPHEADMDQLNGVDFKKGCFIGQEVVSRMEHRGTARTRVVPVIFEGPSPEAGAAVTAGERNVGMMGSAAAGRGLATLRLDRVEEALATNTTLIAGGVAIRVVKPQWARFAVPGEGSV
jgi:folate-binding protein YgfZ